MRKSLRSTHTSSPSPPATSAARTGVAASIVSGSALMPGNAAGTSSSTRPAAVRAPNTAAHARIGLARPSTTPRICSVRKRVNAATSSCSPRSICMRVAWFASGTVDVPEYEPSR